MAAAEPKNKKQWIEQLFEARDWTSLSSIARSAGEGSDLTLPAIAAFADGVAASGRIELAADACDSEWEPLLSKLREKHLSKLFDPAKAQKALLDGLPKKTPGAARRAKLAARIWDDASRRTLRGEFDLWERWKGRPEYISCFVGETYSTGFALSDLLRRLPSPPFNSGEQDRTPQPGAEPFDPLAKVPSDLFELLARDAEASSLWDPRGWDPMITEWGAFSKNDRHCHPLHDLFYTHDGDPETVLRVLRRLPAAEFGFSGRDPLDSALDGAFVKNSFSIVERLVAQDPLALIRPRLCAYRYGRDDDAEWRPFERNPLAEFLASSNPAGGHRYTSGVDYDLDPSDPPRAPGEPRIPVISRVVAWLDACHEIAGSPAARDEWKAERENIFAHAVGDRVPLGLLWTLAAESAERSSKRLGLAPRPMPSRDECLRSLRSAPGRDSVFDFAEKIIGGAKAAEASARQKEDAAPPGASESASKSHASRTEATGPELPDRKPRPRLAKAPVDAFSKAALTRAFQIHGQSHERTRELARAVCQGDAPRALRALKAGADPNGTVGRSDSFLARASALSDPQASAQIVEALLSAGAVALDQKRKPKSP